MQLDKICILWVFFLTHLICKKSIWGERLRTECLLELYKDHRPESQACVYTQTQCLHQVSVTTPLTVTLGIHEEGDRNPSGLPMCSPLVPHNPVLSHDSHQENLLLQCQNSYVNSLHTLGITMRRVIFSKVTLFFGRARI